VESGRILIAGDWHLGTRSPRSHDRLALAFLERARVRRERVILNGDVFETLFLSPGVAERAHPEVAALVERLAGEGLLQRVEGNHDPGSGPPQLVLELSGLGRVLVAHGHTRDPVHRSLIGRLGEAVSRRFGRFAIVHFAMRFADAAAYFTLGRRIVRAFRRRWLAVVEREGFALGVFGHIHVSEVAQGERYVNGGCLAGEVLEYVALEPSGPRLCRLDVSELD
jgi:predicted phosphodiesterase